jgi:transposase
MTREEATALVYGNPEAAVDLILKLVATVEALTARVEELERKIALLTRDSSNSSKPPSSDGPAAKPKARPPMKSKKRNPGGQPGHKGANRDLIPADKVNEVIPVFPETCDCCGAVFTPEPGPDGPTGKYWRHQVIDIPEPKPEVTEYHLNCMRCSCGAENWGKIPQMARLGFGPRLTAFLAHLTGLHRVTRRGCQ